MSAKQKSSKPLGHCIWLWKRMQPKCHNCRRERSQWKQTEVYTAKAKKPRSAWPVTTARRNPSPLSPPPLAAPSPKRRNPASDLSRTQRQRPRPTTRGASRTEARRRHQTAKAHHPISWNPRLAVPVVAGKWWGPTQPWGCIPAPTCRRPTTPKCAAATFKPYHPCARCTNAPSQARTSITSFAAKCVCIRLEVDLLLLLLLFKLHCRRVIESARCDVIEYWRISASGVGQTRPPSKRVRSPTCTLPYAPRILKAQLLPVLRRAP